MLDRRPTLLRLLFRGSILVSELLRFLPVPDPGVVARETLPLPGVARVALPGVAMVALPGVAMVALFGDFTVSLETGVEIFKASMWVSSRFGTEPEGEGFALDCPIRAGLFKLTESCSGEARIF